MWRPGRTLRNQYPTESQLQFVSAKIHPVKSQNLHRFQKSDSLFGRFVKPPVGSSQTAPVNNQHLQTATEPSHPETRRLVKSAARKLN